MSSEQKVRFIRGLLLATRQFRESFPKAPVSRLHQGFGYIMSFASKTTPAQFIFLKTQKMDRSTGKYILLEETVSRTEFFREQNNRLFFEISKDEAEQILHSEFTPREIEWFMELGKQFHMEIKFFDYDAQKQKTAQ